MSTLTLKTKSNGEPVIEGAQAPAALHGQHGLNGIPLIVSEVLAPAPPNPFAVAAPQPAAQISPAPNRRFDGR